MFVTRGGGGARGWFRSVIAMTTDSRATTGRWGHRSLVAALVALIGGLISAVGIGATIGPMELEHGRQLTDTPGWYQLVVWVLGGLMLVWSVLGVAGLSFGIAALVRGEGRARPISAIILAVLGPVITFGLLILLILVTLPG